MQRSILRGTSLAIVLLAGGGGAACSGDDASSPPADVSTTASRSPLEAAADAAAIDVAGVGRSDVEDLIQVVCDGPDADALAIEVVALDVSDSEDLRLVLEGVGDGAEQLCPEVAAEVPELINDAHAAALVLVAG